MTGVQESEAQEQAVGQHGATQASPFHAAPPPPLRGWRELSKKSTRVSIRTALTRLFDYGGTSVLKERLLW